MNLSLGLESNACEFLAQSRGTLNEWLVDVRVSLIRFESHIAEHGVLFSI